MKIDKIIKDYYELKRDLNKIIYQGGFIGFEKFGSRWLIVKINEEEEVTLLSSKLQVVKFSRVFNTAFDFFLYQNSLGEDSISDVKCFYSELEAVNWLTELNRIDDEDDEELEY